MTSIMQLIPRQSGRLVVLFIDGKTVMEQAVNSDDFRGEKLHFVSVDTSTLPQHLGIAGIYERQDQKLVALMSDMRSIYVQARNPAVTTSVALHWVPIDLTGLPEEPAPPPPKPALRVVPKHLN